MKFYNIYPTEVANARWLEQEEDPDGEWCKSAEVREKVEALTNENVMLLEEIAELRRENRKLRMLSE